MSDIAPGWYKDPVDPTVQRYWDGEGWLGEPIPADAPTPSTPPATAERTAEGDATTRQGEGAARQDEATGRVGEGREGEGREGEGTGGESAGADRPAAPTPPYGPEPWITPPGAALPPGTPWPPGVPLPPGTAFPPGAPLPPGTPLPPGVHLPPGLQLPPGTPLPPGAVQVLLPPAVGAGMPVVRPHGLRLAPLWTRLLARLVDIAIVLVLSAVVTGWFVVQWWSDMYPVLAESFRRAWAGQSPDEVTPPERASTLEVVIILLMAALWFAYEVPAIANSGQTIGKRLLRVKVMRIESTEPIGFRRAIRRWNPLGLPTLLWTCAGLGLVLQFLVSLSPVLDWPLRRAFHDRSAGTIVVRVEKTPTQPRENADDPADPS